MQSQICLNSGTDAPFGQHVIKRGTSLPTNQRIKLLATSPVNVRVCTALQADPSAGHCSTNTAHSSTTDAKAVLSHPETTKIHATTRRNVKEKHDRVSPGPRAASSMLLEVQNSLYNLDAAYHIDRGSVYMGAHSKNE